MSLLGLGAHAELDPPRHESEQPCAGRVLVVDQSGPVWTVECEACRTEWGLPARKVDPARHNAQMLERRRSRSGIPAELRGLPFPDDASKAVRTARAWAAGELRGLVLIGPVGVGKTYLAAAAAWMRMTHGPLRWCFVPRLFAELGRGFDDERRHEALDLLAGDGALVLDDLDKARPTEYAAEQLFLAIDTRVTAGAGLLVTSNIGLGELADRFSYGNQIVSRLVGHCETFALTGRDRRLERFAA